jgi:glycine cleavage system aminomethyltransferase T
MYPGRVRLLAHVQLRPEGVVDDLLGLSEDTRKSTLICINAGNIEKDMSWMRTAGGGV